ncbi:hypothetical protein [Brevundimonas sp.]|uniref:hypothetical protein n=1 Tax=Brevundimonas sp. TaxID=1871086 RepID=UPI00289FD0E4|nr:hypothetical protein [Brevundimonas sp.]
MFITSALAASLLLSSGPQEAETPVAVDDVVVSARQLDEQVSGFVRDITVPDYNLNVARWHRDMCVSVVNMQNGTAQYIIDRVAEVALEVGVKSGDPGCSANVIVIAAANANETTREIVDRYRHTLLPDVSGARRSRQALERFAVNDLPVRWWHTSMLINPDNGQSAVRTQNDHVTGEYYIRGGGAGEFIGIVDFPTVEVTTTNLRIGLRSDLSSALIILDMEKLSGISVPQIADYIAMIALTRVNMDSDYSGYHSVLSINSDRDVSGLTEWDMAYLRSIYSADLTHKLKSHQMSELRYLMAERQIRRPLRRQEQPEANEVP